MGDQELGSSICLEMLKYQFHDSYLIFMNSGAWIGDTYALDPSLFKCFRKKKEKKKKQFSPQNLS